MPYNLAAAAVNHFVGYDIPQPAGAPVQVQVTQENMVTWHHIPTAQDLQFTEGYVPYPPDHWERLTPLKTESPHSSSLHLTLASQIEGSVECLHREMGEAEGAIEEIDTRLEVVRENYTAIRDRISNLQKVASQLRTMTGSGPQPNQSKTVQTQWNFAQLAPQAVPIVEVAEQQAEPELLQQGQG